MPIFIGNWDRQDGTSPVRVFIVAIDIAAQTVVVLLDKKLTFNIPANQITWDHWANG